LPFVLTAADLVAAFGNGVCDLPGPQHGPGAGMGVRLVRQEPESFAVTGAVRGQQRGQAGDSNTVSGQQNRSVSAWILVLSPPRERPNA
jgi:hypothetical protein